MDKQLKERMVPLSLAAAVIIADQLTKWIITMTVRPWSVGFSLFGDFFRIVRVYNPGIAFSIGSGLADTARSLMFGLMPLVVLAIVLVVYFRSSDLSKLQRWCVSGIVGGGIGNLIDRFLRPEGVLDFLDVKFYGLFGLERWPTFNVADSSVVVCGIVLLGSILLAVKHERTAHKESSNEQKS
ncbi:MAG TPA: signal peptidase II [Treponemataceae bacterium]|jgi:signal peptidase II|nr:signal peptidase II [Treponema sp.]OQB03954.1 MAG: signal peptidase II [Spirochaetes bacterium ADurb.Bin215]HPX14201.1 signal peptidase II [Treponemataceae bacterium]HQB88715.1 signal peptidase II [Treponemataceae bacterium]